MKKYLIKIELEAEIEAFSESDARDYMNDMFGPDYEVRTMKFISFEELNG